MSWPAGLVASKDRAGVPGIQRRAAAIPSRHPTRGVAARPPDGWPASVSGLRRGSDRGGLTPVEGALSGRAERTPLPTADIGLITVVARDLLDSVYEPGTRYREVRIVSDELSPDT
jgi:hypothetical protein